MKDENLSETHNRTARLLAHKVRPFDHEPFVPNIVKIPTHTLSQPIDIAVDIGTLNAEGAGISRYLSTLLPRMMQLGGDSVEWYLYGRKPEQVRTIDLPAFHGAWDRLPYHVGRITSLFSSLPLWTWRDRPAVFWGPAHRLPSSLPGDLACVVTIHDLCWIRSPETMRITTRWLDRLLMGRAMIRADTIIAVSYSTNADLLEIFPATREKTVVIYEGGSTLAEPVTLREVNADLRERGYFLFVGTSEPRKNLLRLLDAYALAIAQEPGLPTLVVVGSRGWGWQDAQGIAARLNLTKQVIFLGRVNDSHLATLYSHAMCLVMPSLYEGFGLPLVEAMTYGIPVLTSNSSAMREVAGDAGILVDPYVVESIAAGLLKLANDKALRNAMAAKALKRSMEFNWDQAAIETLAVLRRAALTCGAHHSKTIRFPI